MAPADENELQHMLKTAITIDGPVAIRYPRGAGVGVDMDREMKVLPVGKAEIKREGYDVYFLALGNTVSPAIEASKLLAGRGINAGVVNLRFLKPFDSKLVLSLAEKVKKFVVIEENALFGGVTSTVCELLVGKNVEVLPIGIPDNFVEHGHPNVLREKYGLTPEKICEKVSGWMKK